MADRRESYWKARKRWESLALPEELVRAERDAGLRLAVLQQPVFSTQFAAEKAAAEKWERLHPMPQLPRLPWWPRWRREDVRAEHDRVRHEYRTSPDRERFIAQTTRTAINEFHAAYRAKHGVDLNTLIKHAEQELSAFGKARSRRQDAREAAQREMREAVQAMYEAYEDDNPFTRLPESIIDRVAKILGVSVAEVKWNLSPQ